MTRKKFDKPVIAITIPYTLHDWSESLTYEEIDDTLFLIGIYHDEKYKNSLTRQDKAHISYWLKKNDVNIFMKAKELAALAYDTALENEIYARELIGTPYKRPMSH